MLGTVSLAPPRLFGPWGSAVFRSMSRSAGSSGALKSAEDLPGPSTATSLYWLLLRGYAHRAHLLQLVQKRLYGPLWSSRFGPFRLVNVASPRLIACVLQQEGRFPVRVHMPHWKEYRTLRGQADGLHVACAEEWRRLRGALDPRLLKLQEVWSYAGAVQSVVDELLQRMERLRRRDDNGRVCDVASELHKFAFEGICCVLFERRLGCLRDDVPPATRRFIAAVDTMLSLSERVLLQPRWSRRLFPSPWKRFVQAWDELYDVARQLVDQRLSDLHSECVRGERADGLFLSRLLTDDRLSLPQIYICLTELLLGAVDTTSNTLSWALYLLSRDPRVQERLHAEVDAVCPGKRTPSVGDLSRLPYLRAVVKETLRLYPVVPGNGRFISETEVILDDYWFPKETQFHLCHFAVCRDDAYFPESERFLPERWLRSNPRGGRVHAAFSFLPFGVGVRGCVGKRLAEMEMHLALSQLLQHYHFCPPEGAAPVEPRTRTLLVPGSPIDLRLVPRS